MLLSKPRIFKNKKKVEAQEEIEQLESMSDPKINLQDLFNKLRMGGAAQEAKTKANDLQVEEKKRVKEEMKQLSPKSKR